MTLEEAKEKVDKLRVLINKADRAYYVDSQPMMTDQEYDTLYNKLLEIEHDFPSLQDKNSPTSRVGSDIDNNLPESNHSVPVLSLDKCYSTQELLGWIERMQSRLQTKLQLVVEPKIDGASIVLYYNNGVLTKALTRGNGFVGNDITENIKTIHSIPLTIPYSKPVAVRGEVYINKKDFAEINARQQSEKYANARNLASGAVRRQKSKEAATFPLNMFCYEIFLQDNEIPNHLYNLIFLKKLGFPVNEHIGYYASNYMNVEIPFKNATTGTVAQISNAIENLTEQRAGLPYEIDGIVIKINDLATREELGYTQHHPRWAIAYKFDAPLAETTIESISIQVGRGGRVTPVANLKPVELAGSVISRATLHNEDYIQSLEVNVGDLVSISKRGDVIPAVECVIEKRNNPTPFTMPTHCPVCQTKLIKDGAHHFCPNKQCKARMLGTLQYFVSRSQMDIVTLGDKTLEYFFDKGFITKITDIYEFDYTQLVFDKGYGQKKIENIIESVNISKQKDFKIVLGSLGLKDIGNKVAEILTQKYDDVDKIIDLCKDKQKAFEELTQIDNIGDILAQSIIEHFTNPDVLSLITKLRSLGLKFKSDIVETEDNPFLQGTKWVITGSFENYKPRTVAAEIIKRFGGEVIDAVSSKTTHLLCGVAPGSKLDKAKTLGTKIIYENDFLQLLEQKHL